MNIKDLDAEIAKIATGTEVSLFHVEKQIEYDGIVMGVLENGTPYLSEKGLAKLCGIARSVLGELAAGWSKRSRKPISTPGEHGENRSSRPPGAAPPGQGALARCVACVR